MLNKDISQEVMKHAHTVVLGSNQRLVGIQKERHSRQQNVDGVRKDVAYLLVESSNSNEPAVVIAQQLSFLRDWINARGGTQISLTALYNGADRKSESRGTEFIKGRWRVQTIDLTKASDEFELARKAKHAGVIVAAEPTCYIVCA